MGKIPESGSGVSGTRCTRFPRTPPLFWIPRIRARVPSSAADLSSSPPTPDPDLDFGIFECVPTEGSLNLSTPPQAILLGVITYAVAVTASASIAIGSLSAPGIMAPRGMISGNAGLKLRGGADDSAVPTLKRVMSHQDIATEVRPAPPFCTQ